MIKDDCMMFREEVKEDGTLTKHCEGLSDLSCDSCRFYKTRMEYQEQLERCRSREEYAEWLESKKKKTMFDGEIKPY
jgi:hypothetical protein